MHMTPAGHVATTGRVGRPRGSRAETCGAHAQSAKVEVRAIGSPPVPFVAFVWTENRTGHRWATKQVAAQPLWWCSWFRAAKGTCTRGSDSHNKHRWMAEGHRTQRKDGGGGSSSAAGKLAGKTAAAAQAQSLTPLAHMVTPVCVPMHRSKKSGMLVLPFKLCGAQEVTDVAQAGSVRCLITSSWRPIAVRAPGS